MLKSEALDIAKTYIIPLDVDFHELSYETVTRIIQAANARKYRAPSDANGSRARYFHAMLVRASRAKVKVWIVQGNYGHGWTDECEEDSRKEGVARFREYNANGPGCYRLITRRVDA